MRATAYTAHALALALALGLIASCRGDLARAGGESSAAVPLEDPAGTSALRDAGGAAVEAGVRYPADDPPDPAGLVRAEPVEAGPTQCPAWRLLRAERRLGEGASAAVPPAVVPRYYAVDDRGRIRSARELLLCELRSQRWVERGWYEGNNLTLWRGPWALLPDEDCVWREPVRSVGVTASGQRVEPSSAMLDPHQRPAVMADIVRRELTARERCRRRNAAGALVTVERPVRVTVDANYEDIRAEYEPARGSIPR